MARWIDGNPAVRAQMMKQHERMVTQDTVKRASWIKSEIYRLSEEIKQHETALLKELTNAERSRETRRLDAKTKEMNEFIQALERAGITYTKEV